MKTNYLLKTLFLFGTGIMLFSCQSEVEVTLPKIINSNMVLQRNQEVKIWGWGSEMGKVTVSFNGQKKSSRVFKDSTWMVTLNAMDAGGPYEMLIIGKDTTLLNNVMLGDVWVCSGQSNMEWTLANTNNAEEEIANANYPMIRLFDIPHNVQLSPVDDIPSGEWMMCTPENIPDFSSVGYLFGRNLHEAIDVPIGLISTNWGGTNVETWTSGEMCASDPELKENLKEIKSYNLEERTKQKLEEIRLIKESLGALEAGIVDGKAIWAAEDMDVSDWHTMKVPGLWENRGLKGMDGIVWFRREFPLSKEQAGKSITLNLGAIDDSDMTWVNGKLVGETYNLYSKDRIYTVEQGVLKEGQNTLVVRVEDTGGGGGFTGADADIIAKTANGTVPLAGKWKYRVSSADLDSSPALSIGPNDMPTLLYNGMINPIINYSILGAIWYQGEANANNAFKYRTRFPNMITDWRNKWDNQDMGFYFVQLANFMNAKPNPGSSAWAELREAQTMTLSLHKTGMAVITDIGESDNIHPRNKQDVSYRLALAALHNTYEKDIVYSGPVYKSMSIEDAEVTVEFDHLGGGLMVNEEDGVPRGFAIAGDDQQFYWADGKVVDNKIVLSSDLVENPVAIRYAWADNPDTANLYNKEGLPAGPFRTDEWKGITE